MNIIKHGTIPTPKPDWWTLVLHVCPTCGTEWEIDEGDPIINIGAERSPNGKRCCTSVCPVCGATVTTTYFGQQLLGAVIADPAMYPEGTRS